MLTVRSIVNCRASVGAAVRVDEKISMLVGVMWMDLEAPAELKGLPDYLGRIT